MQDKINDQFRDLKTRKSIFENVQIDIHNKNVDKNKTNLDHKTLQELDYKNRIDIEQRNCIEAKYALVPPMKPVDSAEYDYKYKVQQQSVRLTENQSENKEFPNSGKQQY